MSVGQLGGGELCVLGKYFDVLLSRNSWDDLGFEGETTHEIDPGNVGIWHSVGQWGF